MKNKRFLFLASGGVLATAIIAGLFLIRSVLAYGSSGYGQFEVFTQVLRLVQDNYVEPVDTDSLMDGAITGLMQKLDPHSTYLDPKRAKRMQERNQGNFEGIGVSFAIVDGNLTVISPIEGSPSYKLGIRSGDIIAKIDGKSAHGITEQEVFDKLRGPRGTTVHVSILREGEPDLVELDIVRDKIPIYSIPYSFMLNNDTGYIRMTNFGATTSDELTKALEKLQGEGMKQLLFDLRGNAGGYLNAAIEVADKFLPQGKKVVYTRGRLADSNEDYYSTGRGKWRDEPLVVMVDHGSASATEIVSGAIQDWDRGILVGLTTFGKGLVQRPFPLSNGGSLLVTVARYYTPSGRLIQRDYKDREKYLTEDVDEIEQETESDSALATRPVFHTGAGRIVYGGGGVTPDVRVAARYPYSRLQFDLDRARAYFEYVNKITAKEKPHYDTFENFDRDYQVSDAMLNDFTDFLKERKIKFDSDSLKAQGDAIKRNLKAEVARSLWGENERYRVIISADPALKEAMNYFPQAQLMARGDVANVKLPPLEKPPKLEPKPEAAGVR